MVSPCRCWSGQRTDFGWFSPPPASAPSRGETRSVVVLRAAAATDDTRPGEVQGGGPRDLVLHDVVLLLVDQGGGEELPVVVLAVRQILLLAILVLVPSSQGLDHVHPSVGPSSCFLAASSLAVLVPRWVHSAVRDHWQGWHSVAGG